MLCFWSTLAAATLCTSCAAPGLPRLKPSLPAVWRNAEPANIRAPAPDLHHWWLAFNEPALTPLINRALANNLTLAEAVERYRATRTLAQHAAYKYRPSLSAGTNNIINPDTSASYLVAGLDALWELPLFGSAVGNHRLTQGNLDVATADVSGARVALVAAVVQSWIKLRSCQREAQLLASIHTADATRLHLLQAGQELRLVAPDKVATARARLDQDAALLAAPDAATNASAQQLALLLGQDEPDHGWLKPGPLPHLGAWKLTSVPANLLRTRPQIARAEAEVIRAAGQLDISYANIYPHIGIGAALQWSMDIVRNHRVRTGENIFSFGPVIDIPLFDWGERVAREHASDHQLHAAVLAYRQAVLEGVAETEIALGDLHQLGLRATAATQELQVMRTGMMAARKRASLKLASALDVQKALIQQRHAELNLLAARTAQDLAYVALYRALGGAPLPRRSLTPNRAKASTRTGSMP